MSFWGIFEKLHEGNRPSRASAVSFLPTPPSELPPFIFEWSLCLLARVTLHWLLLRSSVPRLFAPICAVRALAISDSGRWLNRDVASVTGTDWHHGHVYAHTCKHSLSPRSTQKQQKSRFPHVFLRFLVKDRSPIALHLHWTYRAGRPIVR